MHDLISGADLDTDIYLGAPVGNGAKLEEHWLIDAADLLAEPDPGPTPWLVQDLIVDGAIIAAVGRWKTTKSYGLLDLCISVATGIPAFGVYEIPEPGPVIFINEESGRAALYRRLDALCRGRAIDPERLRGRLLLGANARVKLDDLSWQHELIELGIRLQPRLFVFDPLARMKAPAREENAQTEMAVLIEFVRLLRDETKSAVSFVHHTGHQGEQMRGSSDLESMWETRLTWKREWQAPTVTISSEHREAEPAEPFNYQIRWDFELRTMSFVAVTKDGLPPLSERIMIELNAHSDTGLTTDEVRAAVNVRRSDVARTLEIMEVAGTAYRTPSKRPDGAGRVRTRQVWKAGSDPTLRVSGISSRSPDALGQASSQEDRTSQRPTSLKESGTDGVPNGIPNDDIPLPEDDDVIF